MAALQELADVLARTSAEFGVLASRALHLRDVLDSEGNLAAAMATEPRPLIISRMTQLMDELMAASLAVRRAEARQLQREGASQQQIAGVFGVSRQRVAALLVETDAERAGRRPHRPRASSSD